MYYTSDILNSDIKNNNYYMTQVKVLKHVEYAIHSK